MSAKKRIPARSGVGIFLGQDSARSGWWFSRSFEYHSAATTVALPTCVDGLNTEQFLRILNYFSNWVKRCFVWMSLHDQCNCLLLEHWDQFIAGRSTFAVQNVFLIISTCSLIFISTSSETGLIYTALITIMQAPVEFINSHTKYYKKLLSRLFDHIEQFRFNVFLECCCLVWGRRWACVLTILSEVLNAKYPTSGAPTQVVVDETCVQAINILNRWMSIFWWGFKWTY